MNEDQNVQKIEDLEHKVREMRWQAIIAIGAALTALAGHAVSYYLGIRQLQLDSQKHGLDIQKLELGNRTIDLGLRELHADYSKSMGVSYDKEVSTIKMISTFDGVPTAIKFEFPFRSGATVRALEEIRENLTADDNNSSDQKLLDMVIEKIPKLLFIDSQLAGNIYCDDTGNLTGTNVDDIVELVKDLPVRVFAQIGDRVGPQAIITGIKSEKPAIIVLHVGSFEGLLSDGESDIGSIQDFLHQVDDTGFRGTVILYSRVSGHLKKIRDFFKDSPIVHNLAIVEMTGGINNGDCFRDGRPNGTRTVRAIKHVVNKERLYSRGAWSNTPLEIRK